MSVSLIGCLIITHEPLDQLASNFMGTRENHRNVLSLVVNFKLSGGGEKSTRILFLPTLYSQLGLQSTLLDRFPYELQLNVSPMISSFETFFYNPGPDKRNSLPVSFPEFLPK